MPTLRFLDSQEDKRMFTELFMAFKRSRRVPKDMDEITKVIDLVKKFHGVSEEKEVVTTQGRETYREPHNGGVEIKINEWEQRYLNECLEIPNTIWNNEGVIIYSLLMERLGGSLIDKLQSD